MGWPREGGIRSEGRSLALSVLIPDSCLSPLCLRLNSSVPSDLFQSGPPREGEQSDGSGRPWPLPTDCSSCLGAKEQPLFLKPLVGHSSGTLGNDRKAKGSVIALLSECAC